MFFSINGNMVKMHKNCLIKTIYIRKQERLLEKKITATDDKYFHIAEEKLYGELAIALSMTKDEAKEFVVSRVNQLISQEI